MYATQVLLGMTVLRVVLPIVALLVMGEWVKTHAHRGLG